MEVDWSTLLPELIEIISIKLTNYADYVRFRAVCVNWCSKLSPIPHHIQVPWLMLSSESHDENRCGFFSLLENKVHRLNIPNTRYPAQTHCCGSSQGWLLLVEERSPSLFLFNPLTGIQIHLPPVTSFPNVLNFNILNVGEEYLLQSPYSEEPCTRSLDHISHNFIRRFTLSSNNPTSLQEDYVVVAVIGIHKAELAFCKKGDENWTMIKDAGIFYRDVIYYKGLFYAVSRKGYVAICDLSGSSPLVTRIAPPSTHTRTNESFYNILYLVADSFGELLLVNKLLCSLGNDYENFIYQTKKFEIFKFDSSKPDWVEVKRLGDRMLFLGTNSSLCLSATDFPGCEGNCIYFTGGGMFDTVTYGKQHDSGVFNVGNGSIKALPCDTGSQIVSSPSLWLTPNPC